MHDSAPEFQSPTGWYGRALLAVSKALAIFGGILTVLVAILVVVSVTGRYLFSAPVPGDYDMIGIAIGCAVFAFLPYCQMVRGNISVDFFTGAVPARGKALLDGIGSLMFLAVAALFTWRLYFGMLDMRRDAEVLAAFNFYRWWTMPLNLACLGILLLAVLYTLTRDVAATFGAAGRAAPGLKE